MNKLAYTSLSLLLLANCAATDDSGFSNEEGARQDQGKDDSYDSADLVDWTLRGSGYPVLDGATITVAFNQGWGFSETRKTTLVDNQFEVTFPKQWHTDSYGAFVHIWFDTSEDGECDASELILSDFVGPQSEAVFGNLGEVSRIWCEEFATNAQQAPDPIDCESACSYRGKICYTQEECNEFCASRVRPYSQHIQDAFEICATQDPLCYIDAHQCTAGVADCLSDCEKDGHSREECITGCDRIYN